jgi:hypothetical protein
MDFTEIFTKLKWGKVFRFQTEFLTFLQQSKEDISWQLYLGMVRVSFEGCVLHTKRD